MSMRRQLWCSWCSTHQPSASFKAHEAQCKRAAKTKKRLSNHDDSDSEPEPSQHSVSDEEEDAGSAAQPMEEPIAEDEASPPPPANEARVLRPRPQEPPTAASAAASSAAPEAIAAAPDFAANAAAAAAAADAAAAAAHDEEQVDDDDSDASSSSSDEEEAAPNSMLSRDARMWALYRHMEARARANRPLHPAARLGRTNWPMIRHIAGSGLSKARTKQLLDGLYAGGLGSRGLNLTDRADVRRRLVEPYIADGLGWTERVVSNVWNGHTDPDKSAYDDFAIWVRSDVQAVAKRMFERLSSFGRQQLHGQRPRDAQGQRVFSSTMARQPGVQRMPACSCLPRLACDVHPHLLISPFRACALAVGAALPSAIQRGEAEGRADLRARPLLR